MTTTVRLPDRLEQMLAQYCVETRRSKSEVIIELLEQRFSTGHAEKSPYEIACEAGFIGSFAAKETRTAPTKERVKAAIREKHWRSA
jgi:predicted transcriptional regulator